MSTAIPYKDRRNGLWNKCTVCKEFVFRQILERNFYICPHCNFYSPMPAALRLHYLFDSDSLTELSVSSIDDELLDAVELKASVDQDTLRTQARWPIAAGKGLISGHPAILTILEPYVVLQRGHFIMLLAAIRTALRRKLPLITVYPSDILPKRTSDKPHKSELSFAEITYLTIEMDDLSCARLPQITILTDPDATVGFSTRLPLGDLVFAELNRECETGPATSWKGGLQQDSSSSDAHCNVIIDHYVQRQNLPATLGKLLAFFARENQ